MVTVSTIQGVIYSSIADLPEQKIKPGTFQYCETFRSVKFSTQLDEIIEIPFENIAHIAHTDHISDEEGM